MPARTAAAVDYDALIAGVDDEIAETESTITRLREFLGRKRTERAHAAGGARRDRLNALRESIEPEVNADGPQLVELAEAAHSALITLGAALQARNERLSGWSAAAREHGATAHTSPAPQPGPEEGHIGWLPGGQGLAVGRWRLRPVDTERILRQLSNSAREAVLNNTEPATFEHLAALDEQAPDVDRELRYFLGPDGSVATYSDEGLRRHIASGQALASLGTEITPDEAVSTWQAQK